MEVLTASSFPSLGGFFWCSKSGILRIITHTKLVLQLGLDTGLGVF